MMDDRMVPLLSQLPSGQMNEDRLEARAANVDVFDQTSFSPQTIEERRQLRTDIDKTRPHDARVGCIDVETLMSAITDRGVNPQRHQPMASDRAIDQLRQRS